jgi:hypothetical protein
MSDAMLPAHGGFKNLRTFQIARLVYDGTAIFCERFIDKRSRTHDQMVQAARSGTQNIAEGSLASATSGAPQTTDRQPARQGGLAVAAGGREGDDLRGVFVNEEGDTEREDQVIVRGVAQESEVEKMPLL